MQSASFKNQTPASVLPDRNQHGPGTCGGRPVSCFLQDYSRDVRQDLYGNMAGSLRPGPPCRGKMMEDKGFGDIAISTPVKHAGCI